LLGDPGAVAAGGPLSGSLVLDGAEDKGALLFFFGDAGAANEITLLADDESGGGTWRVDDSEGGCSCSSVEPPLRSSSSLILCGVGGD